MIHPENDKEYKGLAVNAGVSSQPTVNPYRQVRKRRQLSVSDYVEGILKGDVSILGRAVTLVESTAEAHQQVAQEVIEKCLPYSGHSRRIGITGVPGAGKSTSIDVFGLHVLRQGHKLAVLAIDPSSERTQCSPMPLSVPVPRPGLWGVWHARRERQSCFARLPAMTAYLWRQSE